MVTVKYSIIWRKIIAVIYATYAVSKRKPGKKIRLVRDSNPCPLRYQCSALPIKVTSQQGAGRWIVCLLTCERMMMKLWIFETAEWRIIWRKIWNNSSLRSIHNFIIIFSPVYNELSQRPAPSWLVSLIGKRCKGIAEVKGWIPYKPECFFGLSFRNCTSCGYNCDDLPPNNSALRSSHVWFWYIHNFMLNTLLTSLNKSLRTSPGTNFRLVSN